jgi:hypothetical protein
MALMRFLQSNFSSSVKSEKAPGSRSPNCLLMLGSVGGKDSIASAPGSSRQPGIVFSFGDPSNSKISCACLKSLSPVRIGLCLNISPKTQPTPHMSIAVVYFRN